jgi:hypothetical protein
MIKFELNDLQQLGYYSFMNPIFHPFSEILMEIELPIVL